MLKKITTFAYLIFFSVFSVKSQNQIIPEKKIYQDTTGKIYINKDLPLYFKISKSKNKNAPKKLLISKTTPKYTNPVYLDDEGLNTIYSPWAVDTVTKKTVYPKRNVVFELYADSKAPKTKIHNNITAYEKSDTLFFGKDLKIWFTAKDNISGVKNTFLSINGEKYKQYLFDTLTFQHGKSYKLKYYSTDNTGNYESVKTQSFTIDTTRPLTNLVVIGNHNKNIIAGNCKVSLKPKDAFSGSGKTYYYIDNKDKKIYTHPIDVSNLREGNHILKYYTQDNVSNVENEKSFKFYIDRTPPIVMDEVIGDYVYVGGQAYTSGRSQIQITAIDNKAGVKDIFYSFDGENWNKYEKPFLLPSDQENINIFYYAVDSLGNKTNFDKNKAQNTKLFASKLDLNSPDINHNFSEPKINIFDTLFISNKTKIYIDAKDKDAGIKEISYQIGNKQDVKYEKFFTINEHGYHKITIYATDKVNNIGNSEFSVMVDTIGPQIFVNYSFKPQKQNNELIFPKGTNIYIAATDTHTGVKKITYSINGKTGKIYNNFLKFNSTGKYTVTIKAFDHLSNYRVENFSFKIR